MNDTTAPIIGLAGVPVPDNCADLPAHQFAAHGYCVACWDQPEPQTYAEYVATWYATEYEGDPDHTPWDAEKFAYMAATCLQDGGQRFTNGAILRAAHGTLATGRQFGAAIAANGAPVVFAGTYRNVSVSADHLALYVRSLPASVKQPAASLWGKVVDQPRTPVSCGRTPDELRLALAIVDDLEQSATDAGQPALARQLARAFAAIERFRIF